MSVCPFLARLSIRVGGGRGGASSNCHLISSWAEGKRNRSLFQRARRREGACLLLPSRSAHPPIIPAAAALASPSLSLTHNHRRRLGRARARPYLQRQSFSSPSPISAQRPTARHASECIARNHSRVKVCLALAYPILTYVMSHTRRAARITAGRNCSI